MKFISKTSEIDKLGDQQSAKVTLYNLSGEIDNSLDELNSPAKLCKFESAYRYFIKAGGSESTLFNPRINNLKQLDARKRASDAYYFTFREVTNKCFYLYLDFLKSGNDYKYKQASMARV